MIDKENSLTFQNITQTMKNNKAKKQGLCYQHSQKKAKYRNKDNDCLYCVSCAIQEASKGAVLEEYSKETVVESRHYSASLLQQAYQQTQDQIQESIRIYHEKYQRLLEAITDMQIRDLITFNRKLEQNYTLYKKLKENCPHNLNRTSASQIFNKHASQPILQKIDKLLSIASTRNQFTHSRAGSPLIPSKKSSPQPYSKNKSQPLDSEDIKLTISNNSFQGNIVSKYQSRQSFTKSQPNTCSFQSKNSNREEPKRNVLEDTPESVKNMVEQGGLRVTNDMAVTMFEKIDICESIDMVEDVGEERGKSSQKSSDCSLRRRNRYEGEV